MRSLDWEQTPLGSVRKWPQSLRACVNICLASLQPAILWWGAERIVLYNDACRPILGPTHPRAMGRPGCECCPEIWKVIAPMLEEVLKTGNATQSSEWMFLSHRDIQEGYFSLTHSPISDENGSIIGILTTLFDRTEDAICKRRLRVLQEIGDRTAGVKAIEPACQVALESLSDCHADIPFALLYLIDDDARQAYLVASANDLAGVKLVSCQKLDSSEETDSWRLSEVNQTRTPTIVSGLKESARLRSDRALVMPLSTTGQRDDRLVAFLILGIGSCRKFDRDYRGFFNLVADRIRIAIANARDFQLKTIPSARIEPREKQINAFLESIIDAFVSFDSDWHFTHVNDRATKLLNKSRAELLGKQVWEEIFPNAVETMMYRELHRALSEGVALVFEDFVPHMGLWFEVHAYPFLEGIGIYFRDISQRKQAELEIQKFVSLADNSTDFIGMCDMNFVPFYLNKAGKQIVGLEDVRQYSETPVEEFFFSEDRDFIMNEFFPRVLREGKAEVEIRFRHFKTGEALWMIYNVFYIRGENDRPIGLATVSRDITARKQAEVERSYLLEREQAARAEAERANRIKDEFLAILSHELRSPLNPILGWSQLLRGQKKLDEAMVLKGLETIERNASLQIQLIDDLLDVSRILRGKVHLNIAVVNLAFTVTAAIETIRLAAKSKSIDIQTFIDSDRLQLEGDEVRLQQVVWNLLSNAVKFTPTGGQIGIRVGRIGDMAYLEVKDTGKGISPDFLPYVFEYFRQADSSTTRNFGGLGLGLALVRHIVELHGGTVSARSMGEGKGATFTVRLPLLTTPVESVVPETRSIEPTSKLSDLRILVVDDDPATREFLTLALEQYGAIVTGASLAKEAYVALSKDKFDILLSDIGMPEMNGYDMIRQIRSSNLNGGERIPAIALTAYASELDRRKANEAGFQSHIAKPVNLNELIKLIARLARDPGAE